MILMLIHTDTWYLHNNIPVIIIILILDLIWIPILMMILVWVLNFVFRYDMINCLYSSLIEAILSNCGCSPLVWKEKNYRPCRGHQIQCVQVFNNKTTTTITTMRNFDYIQKYMENFGDKLSGLDRVKNLVTRRNATCLQVIC